MVTVAEVEKAQQAWGEGIVAISAAHGSVRGLCWASNNPCRISLCIRNEPRFV